MGLCNFKDCKMKNIAYIEAKGYCNLHWLFAKLTQIRDIKYEERKISVRKLRRQLKPTEFEEWKRLTHSLLKKANPYAAHGRNKAKEIIIMEDKQETKRTEAIDKAGGVKQYFTNLIKEIEA